MKTRLDKTMELVEGKKQATLFVAEPIVDGAESTQQQKKRPSGMTRKTTYWVCSGREHHVFRHNFVIARDRLDDLRCPECGNKARNKVNENTYIQYRKSTGRVDMKEYRLKQAREAEKRLDRIGRS